MTTVTVKKDRYTVGALYQWDKDQVLQIYGLSLPSVPEIHFTNDTMDRAIVRQVTMDVTGIISVNVPNSLLQKPYTIKVYVCVYEDDRFNTLYKIEIPVKARNKPSDYTIEDSDGEIYSFNALEKLVVNTSEKITNVNNQLRSDLANENEKLRKNLSDKCDQTVETLTTKYDETKEIVDTALDNIESLKNRVNEAEEVVQGYEDRVTDLETNGVMDSDLDPVEYSAANFGINTGSWTVVRWRAYRIRNIVYLNAYLQAKITISAHDSYTINTPANMLDELKPIDTTFLPCIMTYADQDMASATYCTLDTEKQLTIIQPGTERPYLYINACYFLK